MCCSCASVLTSQALDSPLWVRSYKQAVQQRVTQLQWCGGGADEQQHTWNSSCSRDRTACCSMATKSCEDIMRDGCAATAIRVAML